MFGPPRVIHEDPGGGNTSEELREYCTANGIELDLKAGEAHWQNGAVERAAKEVDARLGTVLSARPPKTEAEWLLVFYEVMRSRNMLVH